MPAPVRASDQNPTFFSGASAGMADLKLAYALDQNQELALLVGDPGLGKTTVLRRFADRAVSRGDVVVDVFFPQLDADQLVAFIDGELGTPDDLIGQDRHASLRRIARRAGQLAKRERAIILIIDDAHLLTDRQALETLQSLLNLRKRESVQVTIVLAGEKSLLANLARVPALAGRVGVTAALCPLDVAETRTYLRHRRDFATCGEDMIERLHWESSGNPRSLNRLAEMATLLARAEGRESLTVADLENLTSEVGMRGRAA